MTFLSSGMMLKKAVQHGGLHQTMAHLFLPALPAKQARGTAFRRDFQLRSVQKPTVRAAEGGPGPAWRRTNHPHGGRIWGVLSFSGNPALVDSFGVMIFRGRVVPPTVPEQLGSRHSNEDRGEKGRAFPLLVHARFDTRVCVRACVRAFACVRVRACGRAGVFFFFFFFLSFFEGALFTLHCLKGS